MLKVILWAGLGISGAALVVGGLWMLSPVAGIIAGGVALLVIAGAMAL